MESENTFESEPWSRLKDALEDGKYRWRTAGGLSRDSGLSVDHVLELLREHKSEIIKSALPSKQGEALYTTREHYKANSTFLASVKQSLTGRVQ